MLKIVGTDFTDYCSKNLVQIQIEHYTTIRSDARQDVYTKFVLHVFADWTFIT